MIIFVKIRLHDSMTVELFSLALADFLVATLELGVVCMDIVDRATPLISVDLQALSRVHFTWAVNAAYLTSCWITVIVSLERCFSVAYPFQVKQLFTMQRSSLAVLAVYVIHIVMFVPGFVIEKMEWVNTVTQNHNISDDSDAERWIYTVVYSYATAKVETVLRMTSGLFLFSVSQSVLFVCSVWMTIALKTSARIRVQSDVFKETDNIQTQLTKKETRLLTVVLFLSLLHLVCNLPRLSLSVFFYTYPWSSAVYQRNAINIMWAIMAVFSNVTCCSSFCGYYQLNSKYRKIVHMMFQIKDM
ncbi:growth hormone secretagogue receptor type 1 [Biomphalaria glabrata]|nr:growth hormone secretagogue receptor type 1 [Biomphalaria glabrata]